MLACADVKCYFCGHVSGEVCGDLDEPIEAAIFRPHAERAAQAPTKVGRKPRCLRCGGPVYLEDVRPWYQVHTYHLEPDSEEGKRRRGRKASSR